MKKKVLSKGNARPHVPGPAEAFPIVAIGASSGGLKAVTELFRNLSPRTGMAYIYVQHLSPDHKSGLTEILSRITRMKVQEIENMDEMRPDCVYIIPPNRGIEVTNGHIKLTPRNKSARAVSIDILFTTLAETHKENVIGIILSGSARDGTRGLKSIQHAGGLTFAQDDTAEYKSMPHSVIAEGLVDFVMPPRKIAQEINRLSRHALIKRHAALGGQKVKGKATGNFADNPVDPDLIKILELLRKSFGTDFSGYKMSTIQRRIQRRMLLHRSKTLKQYARLLSQKKDELHLLFNDVLINVTDFFRDPEVFRYLKNTLFPKLLKKKNAGSTLRIWVAACSTGQEAYSIAITLQELFRSGHKEKPVQIFATDLSEQAINKARAGVYTLSEVQSVSPDQRARYFTSSNGEYKVHKTIRDMCAFAPHNILRDPPFSKLDFLSCRNFLIYLKPAFQKRAMGIFHYALNDNGCLMLGQSESADSVTTLFSTSSKRFKIYSRVAGVRTLPRLLPHYVSTSPPAKGAPREIKHNTDYPALEQVVNSILLSEYAPASAVIRQDLSVVQLTGDVSGFLHLTPGKTSLNILKMTRPEIAFELRNAIHTAIHTLQPVQKTGIEIKTNSAVRHISFNVKPIRAAEDGTPFLLIVFAQEQGEVVDANSRAVQKNITPGVRRVRKLEEEISSLRTDLLSVTQEHEQAIEELQLTNEVITAANEELQGINEELETSKEEVESTNEELNATNQELQTRNEQLAESNSFSEAIIATMHEPMLIMDRDMNIISANKAFYVKFRVKKEEVEGKFLFEAGNRQWDIPQLHEMLDNMLTKRIDFYEIEITHHFPGLGEKILLLNGQTIVQKTRHQLLILLAIDDITERVQFHRQEKALLKKDIHTHQADKAELEKAVKQRTIQLEQKNTEMESLFRYATMGIVVVNTGGEIVRINPFAEKIFQYESNELIGEKVERLFPFRFSKKHEENRKGYNENDSLVMDAPLDLFGIKKDGTEFPVEINLSPYTTTRGHFIIAFIADVTSRKIAQALIDDKNKALKRNYRSLKEKNVMLEKMNKELETFTFVASHDLQEPLRKVKMFAAMLLEDEWKNLSISGKDYLSRMQLTVSRMRKLLEDLLAYSRTKSPKPTFEKMDIVAMMNEVIVDFRERIEEKNATVQVVGSGDAEVIRFQFRQVLHNLLSNALKFSRPNRNARIKIKCAVATGHKLNPHLQPDKEYLHLSITDNGIGFEPQYSDRIFEVFQRLHERKQYEGTGIGLPICKRIVENHNGMITATGRPNKGATFDVYIPQRDPRKQKQGTPGSV